MHKFKVIDHGLKTKMQVIQLARIIREHPCLKDLTVQMHKMHFVQCKKLLWSCWNIEKVDIATRFYYSWPRLLVKAYNADEEERGLDAWITEHRPKLFTALTDDNRLNGKDNIKVPFQIKEFYLHAGRYSSEFGTTFEFLRRCHRLERLRPPRTSGFDQG